MKFVLNIVSLLLLLPWPTVAQGGDDPERSTGRVIIKYRDDGNITRLTQEAGRIVALSDRLKFDIIHGQHISEGRHVVTAQGISSEALANQLSALPEVEYAEPDRLRKAHAAPDDPLYSGQWHLQSEQVSAVNFAAAWARTIGISGPIVAVLDTGITDHPDLYGKLVPGYNFISNAALAGNNIGRTDDPHDPGDYIDASVRANPDLVAICGRANLAVDQSSSWHGTRVAGLIGARTNNGVGIAGAGWGTRILPIRVLGKCGGFDSDIQAAMRWAAGLTVPGVPDNPNPAKIINLSLGSTSSCSHSYQETIRQLAELNVLVVASAGNEAGPVEAPANCPGVMAVGGLRHEGDKVGYSSYGPEVGISSPAGNCGSTSAGAPCFFTLDTTVNLGTKGPTKAGYTNQHQANYGTSFSAPLVAATAALMLDANPQLSSAALISKIKYSARPFTQVDGRPTCPITNSYGQCNCTTTTCGAGMLDAEAAIAAATTSYEIPQTGWWWNPAESGRGFSLETNGRNLFMAAYLYDPSGRAAWYATGGALNPDGSYDGYLQEFYGGQTLLGAYISPIVLGNISPVHLGCPTAVSCTLTWSGGTVPIQRFIFDANLTPSGVPETGWWWNANESGRGYFIEIQGNTMFATAYMYDPLGNSVWYLTSGSTQTNFFSNIWSQYGYGQTLNGPYHPASVVNPNIGSATLGFSSPTTATLTLPNAQTISLTRFRF